jgi:hypothetical protein
LTGVMEDPEVGDVALVPVAAGGDQHVAGGEGSVGVAGEERAVIQAGIFARREVVERSI